MPLSRKQTVTFGAGSLDGTTQSVQVQVLDDTAIEIDETMRLALSAPSAGTLVGATSLHQLTIRDDDTPGVAALVASEGPSGVESSLSYDELIDLGSQTVGAGPNAGTRVRVTNAGGALMHLGAPRVTGTEANDFAVTVEAAPLAPAGFGAAGELGPDALSPLLALPEDSDLGSRSRSTRSWRPSSRRWLAPPCTDFRCPGWAR